MRLKPRPRLAVDQLEDRCVPASIFFSGGSLTISNNKAAITVTQNANGSFTVFDGLTNQGTYNVGNNITVNTGNLNDTITLNLFSGKLLPGTFTVNSMNGSDTVTVNGNGGRIGRDLCLNTSNGNDSITIGNGSKLTVSGKTVIKAGFGIDDVTIDAGASTITFGNSVTMTQANTVTVGAGGSVVNLNGNLVIDNSADGAALPTGNSLEFRPAATVSGSFNYVGGTGGDTIILEGTVGVVGVQAVTLNMGVGTNVLDLSGVVGLGVDADLIYIGGNSLDFGSDSVTFQGTAAIQGDVLLDMRNSTNFYDLNSNFTVGGTFTLIGGEDVDDVGIIDGAISGAVTVTLGGGADSVTFGSGGFLAAIGGSLTVDAGADDDAVILNVNVGGGTANVSVNLGSGADTFSACNAVVPSGFGAATIDLGVDADADFVEIRTALFPVPPSPFDPDPYTSGATTVANYNIFIDTVTNC